MFYKIMGLGLMMNVSLLASDNDTYALKTNEEGARNLQAQHEVMAESSEDHLRQSGLSEGQIVWELGCGTGCVTPFIAKTIGNSGHVYCIDISQEQLETAKKTVLDAGLENVTFITGDVCNLSALKEAHDLPAPDLIYGRFILMHLKSHAEVIQHIFDVLKTGGKAVFQESDLSEMGDSNNSSEMQAFTTVLMKLGESFGLNYGIGSRLHAFFQQSGFKLTSAYDIQTGLSVQAVKTHVKDRIIEVRPKLLDNNIATAEEIEGWISYCQNLSEDMVGYTFNPGRQHYFIAEKE